jgi:tetratricopeptide (TPR) repeat protein
MENARWAFTSGHASNWHPVTWLSHMADVELFGMNPRGHHLVNIILHAANACLLFLFLHGASGAPWRSAFVAAFFAVHPLHLESVAWVAERKDVLSTCFGLLTLLAYRWYVRSRDMRCYAAVIACFALGLMAKPMLVTLPFLLLLLDYWPLQRWTTMPADSSRDRFPSFGRLPVAQLLMEKLPLFLLAALSSGITFYVQRAEAVHTLDVTPLSLRIGNALAAYLRYLGKTIWPGDLAVLYPLPAAVPLLQSVGCSILLLGISCSVYVLARRRAYLPVGWFWFLGTLVPVIGLVQVGLQSMADRYTYFPLIGIFIMIVWVAADFAAQHPSWRIPLAVAAAGVIALCSAVTWKNEAYWKDSATLFTHAVAVTTDNYYAHYMLGKAFYEDGNFPDALAQYVAARQLNPRFAEAYINMGIIQAKQGNQAEALQNFTTALSLKPGSPTVHYNIAVALQAQRRLEEAIPHYREALRLDPDNVGAHYNLAVAFMDLGRWDEAIRHFTEAVRLKPELEDARLNLQMCLQRKGGR